MRWQVPWIASVMVVTLGAVSEAQPPREGEPGRSRLRDYGRELELTLQQIREIERRLEKLGTRLDEMAAQDKEAKERKAKEAAKARDEAKPKGRPEDKAKAKPEAKKDGPPERRFGPPGFGRPGFGPWRPPMGDRWGRPGFGPRRGAMPGPWGRMAPWGGWRQFGPGGGIPGPWGGFRPFDFRRPDRPEAREDAARRAEQIAEQLERMARELRRR